MILVCMGRQWNDFGMAVGVLFQCSWSPIRSFWPQPRFFATCTAVRMPSGPEQVKNRTAARRHVRRFVNPQIWGVKPPTIRKQTPQ